MKEYKYLAYRNKKSKSCAFILGIVAMSTMLSGFAISEDPDITSLPSVVSEYTYEPPHTMSGMDILEYSNKVLESRIIYPDFVKVPDHVYSDYDSELKCLADNIYFEARNQIHNGKLAVGLVTINRVNSSRFPDTICDVVWQKRTNNNGVWVAQFSWTLDGKSDRPKNSVAYQDAINVASALLDRNSSIEDFTHGSDHYHATYVSPAWANDENMVHVASIDSHLFYRYDR